MCLTRIPAMLFFSVRGTSLRIAANLISSNKSSTCSERWENTPDSHPRGYFSTPALTLQELQIASPKGLGELLQWQAGFGFFKCKPKWSVAWGREEGGWQLLFCLQGAVFLPQRGWFLLCQAQRTMPGNVSCPSAGDYIEKSGKNNATGRGSNGGSRTGDQLLQWFSIVSSLMVVKCLLFLSF